MQSSVVERLSTITSHLEAPTQTGPTSIATTSASAAPRATDKMPTTRPPITCHILDTLTGLPAPAIPVTMTLLSSHTRTSASSTPLSFSGTTNQDGRIPGWTPSSSSPTSEGSDMQALFENVDLGEEMFWVARFETRQYFDSKEIKPFFPEVEIRFLTTGFGVTGGEEKGHWHVPLLLGPYSYTTYRGS